MKKIKQKLEKYEYYGWYDFDKVHCLLHYKVQLFFDGDQNAYECKDILDVDMLESYFNIVYPDDIRDKVKCGSVTDEMIEASVYDFIEKAINGGDYVIDSDDTITMTCDYDARLRACIQPSLIEKINAHTFDYIDGGNLFVDIGIKHVNLEGWNYICTMNCFGEIERVNEELLHQNELARLASIYEEIDRDPNELFLEDIGVEVF